MNEEEQIIQSIAPGVVILNTLPKNINEEKDNYDKAIKIYNIGCAGFGKNSNINTCVIQKLIRDNEVNSNDSR